MACFGNRLCFLITHPQTRTRNGPFAPSFAESITGAQWQICTKFLDDEIDTYKRKNLSEAEGIQYLCTIFVCLNQYMILQFATGGNRISVWSLAMAYGFGDDPHVEIILTCDI